MAYLNPADKLEWQRQQRRKTGNIDTKRYEKTKSGFLMRVYRNMQSRVQGIQKQKAHLYSHINHLPTRAEFYAWADRQDQFHRLFGIWEASGYARKLTPSVDRRDSNADYSFSNLEWVTHSENSRRGAKSRWEK